MVFPLVFLCFCVGVRSGQCPRESGDTRYTFQTFGGFGNERDADAVFPGIAAMGIARQIAARQDGDMAAFVQAACEFRIGKTGFFMDLAER